MRACMNCQRGNRELLSVTNSLVALFAHPVVAALLGTLLGASLLVLTRTGVRFMTPEFPELGVTRAVALSMLGLVLAFVALLLYYLYVRPGLVAFGIGLIVGFLVPALVALFAFSGLVKTSS